MTKWLKYCLMSGLLLLCGTVLAADLVKDNGTSPDGVMIFPQQMAMLCDLSSKDYDNSADIQKCFKQIMNLAYGPVGNRPPFSSVKQKILHQASAAYLENALNVKAKAGDYEDIIDKEVVEQSEEAGAVSSGENVRKYQEQDIRLSGKATEDLVKIIDVYSAYLANRSLDYFLANETTGEALDIYKQQGLIETTESK